MAGALNVAGSEGAREWLRVNPVSLSWEHATGELLSQYDEAIQANLPYRREVSSRKVALLHTLMAGASMLALWWLTRIYARVLIRLFARLMLLDVVIAD